MSRDGTGVKANAASGKRGPRERSHQSNDDGAMLTFVWIVQLVWSCW